MANALIIKSGGGGLTVKSGGTVAVKSADPGYVVAGLTQSHWLAGNSVRTGSVVNTVTDTSGLTNLVGGVNMPTYSATGWSSGGKTLPTMSFVSNGNPGQSPLTANAWASRVMAGLSSGVFTLAYLAKQPKAGGWFGITNANGTSQIRFGDWNGNGSECQFAFFQQGMSDLSIWNVPNLLTNTNHCVVVEFDFSSSKQNPWRVWKNGSAQTMNLEQNGTTQRPTGVGSTLLLGMKEPGQTLGSVTLAEFHIYQGQLTDAQRNAVTSDLMTRGGL